MVDQMYIDMSERLKKLELDMQQMEQYCLQILSYVKNHKHIEDGSAAMVEVKITRLADPEVKA